MADYEVVEIETGEVVAKVYDFKSAVLEWMRVEGPEQRPNEYKGDMYGIKENGNFIPYQELDARLDQLMTADPEVAKASEEAFT